jgi:putative transposase
MPRISRGVVSGLPYHVLSRGNGGQRVFRKQADYDAFIKLLREAKDKYEVKLLAYCLMPNHFHLVIIPQEAEDLSSFMQWLLTSHVRRYHRHYQSSGHVWQGRFRSFLIQKDVHLLAVLRYVEANPVRAGLKGSAREWNWSSHREAIGLERLGLRDKAPMAPLPDWREFVDTPLARSELDGLRESVIRQRPYGEARWQIRMCRQMGLESTLKPRGRPRKK